MHTAFASIGIVRLYVFQKNGDLRIKVSTGQPALLLRLGKSINGKIHKLGGPAVIEFSKSGIALKVGKHVVYEKSREMLLHLKDGSRWIEQLDREVSQVERQRFEAFSLSCGQRSANVQGLDGPRSVEFT